MLRLFCQNTDRIHEYNIRTKILMNTFSLSNYLSMYLYLNVGHNNLKSLKRRNIHNQQQILIVTVIKWIIYPCPYQYQPIPSVECRVVVASTLTGLTSALTRDSCAKFVKC